MQPITIVIFGASGDLTERKLIPALYNAYCKGSSTSAIQHRRHLTLAF